MYVRVCEDFYFTISLYWALEGGFSTLFAGYLDEINFRLQILMCFWGSSGSDEFRNCFPEAFDDWAMSERRLQKISFLLGSSLQPLPVGLIYIIS